MWTSREIGLGGALDAKPLLVHLLKDTSLSCAHSPRSKSGVVAACDSRKAVASGRGPGSERSLHIFSVSPCSFLNGTWQGFGNQSSITEGDENNTNCSFAFISLTLIRAAKQQMLEAPLKEQRACDNKCTMCFSECSSALTLKRLIFLSGKSNSNDLNSIN